MWAIFLFTIFQNKKEYQTVPLYTQSRGLNAINQKVGRGPKEWKENENWDRNERKVCILLVFIAKG